MKTGRNYPKNRKTTSYRNQFNIEIKQTDPSVPKSLDKEYLTKYQKEYNRRRTPQRRQCCRVMGPEKFIIKKGKVLVTFE
jgi:hypothetical protein